MKNPFESLRRPGIVGQVVSSDFSSHNIHECGYEESVTIYTGELIPGCWSFGFLIVDGEYRARVLPGELEGWFKSESDALLYALGYLKAAAHVSVEARMNIDSRIYEIMNPSMF